MHVIAGFEGVVLTFRNARELRGVADHLQGFAEHAEADDPNCPRSYAISLETIPEQLPAAAVDFERAAAAWQLQESEPGSGASRIVRPRASGTRHSRDAILCLA